MINEITKLEVEIMKYEEFLDAFSGENGYFSHLDEEMSPTNIFTESQL